MPRKAPAKPPDWWNKSLYGFLKGMPLKGWVWEFYRRAVLKQNLGDLPVDAMNPEPDFEKPLNRASLPEKEDGWFATEDSGQATTGETVLSGWNHNLYLPWKHPHWRKEKPMRFWGSIRPVGFFVPSLSEWGQYSSKRKIIGGREFFKEAIWVDIRVDMQRPNSVILSDMKDYLRILREKYPEPKRINPRITDWVDNRILQVWDLREFGVSWKSISKEFFADSIQYDEQREARNAYNSATKLIEGGDWLRLAFYANKK